MSYKEIQQQDIKTKSGKIEPTIIFTCFLCRRKWYSKGVVKKEIFHAPSMIRVPSRCPCHMVKGGTG